MFGILTTYSEWRICWLTNKESKNAAEATEIKLNNNSVDIQEIDSIPDWDDDFESIESDEQMSNTPKRKINGTRIIQSNDQKLPLYLRSVLLKMFHSPHSKVHLVDNNRLYIQLNDKNWSWVSFNKDLQFNKVNII